MSSNIRQPLSYYIWPLGIVVFLLIIAVVNLIILSLAVENHPGLIEDSPYEKGLAYEEVISQRRNANELGLTAIINASMPLADGKRLVTVQLSGPAEELTNLRGSILAQRPSETSMDNEAELSATDSPGQFQAYMSLPLSGLWLFEIKLSPEISTSKREKSFLIKKRVFVQ